MIANIHLYNSLNWDDYNAETHTLLAGVPGTSEYCQIGIGTDTLSVGVDMPAIADAILIGNIEDADEAFQKIGCTGRCADLVAEPRGIIYTTVAAREAAEQALAAVVDSETEVTTVDLSWPTMVCAKCKKLAQHKLYNEGIIDVPCT